MCMLRIANCLVMRLISPRHTGVETTHSRPSTVRHHATQTRIRWGLDGCREAGGGKTRQLGGKEKRADIAEIKMAKGKGDWIQRILTQLQH